MSEEEKYATQGRVHAELKQARSNIATITSTVQRSARELEEAALAIHRLLRNPDDQAANVSLQEALRRLNAERLIGLLRDLDAETQTARLLQERVDRF